MKALIIFLLILGVLGGIAFFVVKMILKKVENSDDFVEDDEEEGGSTKNSKSTSSGVVANEGPKNAQSLLQFKNIKDGVIDLGKDRYRVVIEVSSTNYYLKTQTEKETIEMAFQSFLNSLSFPITIYCQTRIIDNTEMLRQLKEDIVSSIDEFPTLRTYGELYYQGMLTINDDIGNNKAKKKYIIVPFEDLDELTEFSKEEKYEEALKRISQRAFSIVDGLAPIDLKGHILNTEELIELIYTAYNKGDISNVNLIASGEYMTPIVTGENKLANVSGVAMTDYILFEAQNEIKNKVLNKSLPEHQVKVYSSIINHLGSIRDDIIKLEENEE